jgi:hypothetical protein
LLKSENVLGAISARAQQAARAEQAAAAAVAVASLPIVGCSASMHVAF